MIRYCYFDAAGNSSPWMKAMSADKAKKLAELYAFGQALVEAPHPAGGPAQRWRWTPNTGWIELPPTR